MIFRALFWIGLVALLMPHEPDLGFGRPGTDLHMNRPTNIAALMRAGDAPKACTGGEAVCVAGRSLLARFQTIVVRNLDQVRADIEAHRQKSPYGI